MSVCTIEATLLEDLSRNTAEGTPVMIPVLKEYEKVCAVARRLVDRGLAVIEHTEALILWVRRPTAEYC